MVGESLECFVHIFCCENVWKWYLVHKMMFSHFCVCNVRP